MTDHEEMRPECATHFGEIHAEISNLKDDVARRREEYKELGAKIDYNREAVISMFQSLRNDVTALKTQARGWGAIGGLFAALVTISIAIAAWAFG